MNTIVLYDGVCNLCNHSVQFIIKRDPSGAFHFASQQSDIGKKLLADYHLSENATSVILLQNGTAYVKSSAALKICKQLTGGWRLLAFLIIIPRPIRDFLYEFVAKNRYKWFGKNESCMLPSKEIRDRFLDI